tara:strand:+ start:8420 stop:9802 length:1383 start_codon:yes stop_codon:yes gene_type:complete
MKSSEKPMFKLGTSSSEISTNEKFIEKKIIFNNNVDKSAFKKGLKVLLNSYNKSILAPIEIIDNETKQNTLKPSLIYIQEIKKPWIYPEWITGKMLYDLGGIILKQQEILITNGFCLVDCRPENYWLAPNPPKLVDLGGIKPLTEQNIESFKSDFNVYIFNPLLIEKELNIPVSAYYKGGLQKNAISATKLLSSWFSFRILKHSFINYFNTKISQEILNSSPEFIDYLNRSFSKRDESPSIKFRKNILSLQKKLIQKVKPSFANKSEWIDYQYFHDEEYTNNKYKSINLFISKIDPSRNIVDLGANLTTIKNNRINIRIDKDIEVCRKLQAESKDGQITLLIDIAEALTQKDKLDFMSLNCKGFADTAIMMGLIHHIVIDSGLNLKALYYSLSLLYKDILLEFPKDKDPMVSILMKKKNEFLDWSWEGSHSEACKKWFNIINNDTLSDTRFAVHLQNKNL